MSPDILLKAPATVTDDGAAQAVSEAAEEKLMKKKLPRQSTKILLKNGQRDFCRGSRESRGSVKTRTSCGQNRKNARPFAGYPDTGTQTHSDCR